MSKLLLFPIAIVVLFLCLLHLCSYSLKFHFQFLLVFLDLLHFLTVLVKMVIWVWLNFWIWALRMAVWIVGALLWCLFDEVFLYKACAGSYLPWHLACCCFFLGFVLLQSKCGKRTWKLKVWILSFVALGINIARTAHWTIQDLKFLLGSFCLYLICVLNIGMGRFCFPDLR